MPVDGLWRYGIRFGDELRRGNGMEVHRLTARQRGRSARRAEILLLLVWIGLAQQAASIRKFPRSGGGERLLNSSPD